MLLLCEHDYNYIKFQNLVTQMNRSTEGNIWVTLSPGDVDYLVLPDIIQNQHNEVSIENNLIFHNRVEGK